MRSTSYTQPAHVPPLARCSAAQSRVSSGSCGVRRERRMRRARRRAAPRTRRGGSRSPPTPTRLTVPVRRVAVDHDLDQIVVAHAADRSAAAAPRARCARCTHRVEKPEKRPSVSSATCFPHGRYLSAVVICAVSCIPVPDGPLPISTMTSPASDRAVRRRPSPPGSLRARRRRRAPGRDAETRRSASTTDGSIAVALITDPSGARLPDGKHNGAREPGAPRRVRAHDHVVRLRPARPTRAARAPRAGARSTPTSRASCRACRRSR